MRLLLISYRDYRMLFMIELRQALVSYRDYRMLFMIELRQALIPYQDYHMFWLNSLAGTTGPSGCQRSISSQSSPST